MVQKSASINLLKGRGKSVFDIVIDWSLSIGRVIIIITELLALGAFLWRFQLDAQLTDLHSSIKHEQEVLAFLKPNEDTYRKLQTRLALARQLNTNGQETVKIVNDIFSMAGDKALISDLSVLPQSVTIDASTLSIQDLTDFVNRLKSYPKIKGISIDKIENRSSNNQLDVSITVQI